MKNLKLALLLTVSSFLFTACAMDRQSRADRDSFMQAYNAGMSNYNQPTAQSPVSCQTTQNYMGFATTCQ